MSRYREWEISCKVYIGNLGSSASKHEIESAFSKYGPLRNVWVARNPPGFAFVEFEDPRDAEDAVRGLDGTRCCGTKVKVEMSTGRRRHSGGGRRPGPRYSSEQDLRTIYLFDKFIGPDLAVLVGNLWVVIQGLGQEVREDHP
ncbi:serine/arginine-rich splicing factor 3 isoform X1 [Vespula maculifrons]|uniref:Serine/arginine-rich splicing factor 3 isoform X1 n=1 Tax=Vespula maculifrons TaxID=7453 RepID=A0ABD2CTS9_VESMC